MNFKNLLETINKIDKPLVESNIGECGEMIPPTQQQQQDSVSMSVNMNAAGPDGIRDLMKIMRSIEQPASDLYHDASVLFGGDADSAESDNEQDYVDGEYDIKQLDDEYANSDDGKMTFPVSRVLQRGDDLSSKGGEAPKQAGGGNPYKSNVSESLLGQLRNLYTEVKGR